MVVLVVVILFIVVDGVVYLFIKNILLGGVYIYCVLDLQMQVNYDLFLGFIFGFDIYGMDFYYRELLWICSFMGFDFYSGMFLLWMIKGGFCYSVFVCFWVLDDYGLLLIRYDGCLEYVYCWF